MPYLKCQGLILGKAHNPESHLLLYESSRPFLTPPPALFCVLFLAGILDSSSDTPAATPAHVRTSPTVNMGVLQRSMMANGSSPTLVALNCTVLDPRSACHKCLAVISNYIAYLCRYGFSSAIGVATLAFSAEHT